MENTINLPPKNNQNQHPEEQTAKKNQNPFPKLQFRALYANWEDKTDLTTVTS